MIYSDELIKFLEQSKNNNLKTAHFKQELLGLQVKVSFGQGNAARIPWISFLSFGQTTSKGIYPVYLLFKKQNLLILAYGISETQTPTVAWPLKKESINEYFRTNNLGYPERYGNSMLYKVYSTDNLPTSEVLDRDLLALVGEYKAIDFGEKDSDQRNEVVAKEIGPFDHKTFHLHCLDAGLKFSDKQIVRFVSSLLTKPFVILTGLSGSGKTKLAQAFCQWISEDKTQYRIVPVGADWTNREPLLGYPNGLNPEEYITPDSGVLDLIIEAAKGENDKKPYFLILDEMNLSHVERYFADFLSIMESKDKISLYSGSSRKSPAGFVIPNEVAWPSNLFIIGTVNIDETTYMFSPKVLDRANTIEFRLEEQDMQSYFDTHAAVDLNTLSGQGALSAFSFLQASSSAEFNDSDGVSVVLINFFKELKKVGAEYGYRTASEMLVLIANLKKLDNNLKDAECIDIAVMQKLLPKLHGSRSKILKTLEALTALCLIDSTNFIINNYQEVDSSNVQFPIAFEKLTRMYNNAMDNGFTSYAEA